MQPSKIDFDRGKEVKKKARCSKIDFGMKGTMECFARNFCEIEKYARCTKKSSNIFFSDSTYLLWRCLENIISSKVETDNL